MDDVIERVKDTVYRLACNQMHDRDKADEVFQNVMLRYIKKKPVFESLEHEKAWFIRVTLNCSKTYLSSFWNNKVVPLEDHDLYIDRKNINLDDYLKKLPKKYNAVLYLNYYEGYSTKEIAKIINIKENNVRILLMRARNKLKEELMKDATTL